MTELKELKQRIINKNLTPDPIIFVGEHLFIADQYINEISNIRSLPIYYTSSLGNSDLEDIFNFADMPPKLNIYTTKELDCSSFGTLENNTIIKCNSIKNIKQDIDKFIYKIPALDNILIDDYTIARAKTVPKNKLLWLNSIANYNIYRIQNELDKLLLFTEGSRESLFNDMIEQGAFNDLSSQTIFNFTNALLSKDIQCIEQVMCELENIDIEPIGLVTIMHKNLKNLILVRNGCGESAGLSSKQIYAIGKLKCPFTNKQLEQLLIFINQLDFEIKNGLIDIDIIIDYITCKFLSI